VERNDVAGDEPRDLAVAYQDLPYDDLTYPATHPDRLYSLARLHGLTPPSPDRARILELGCGPGGNPLALAAQFPDAEVVGVDLAAEPLQAAIAHRDALGLGNLHLEARDLRTLPASWGSFDVIICHGVYSWVPPEVRAAILDTIAARLSPDGVAYLSYNAYPGWHARGLLRDLLRRQVPSGPPRRRTAAARQVLAALAARADVGELSAWLTAELSLLETLSDSYLYFEHLAEHNQPFYVSEVAGAAAARGLTVFADADPTTELTDPLDAAAHQGLVAVDGPAVGEVVARAGHEGAAGPLSPAGDAGPLSPAGDAAQTPAARPAWRSAVEALDLLTFRSFARSLLCHAAAAPQPRDAQRVAGARVRTDLRIEEEPEAAGAPLVLTGADARQLVLRDPDLRALLGAIARSGPLGCPVDELPVPGSVEVGGADAQALRNAQVLDLFSRGQVQVSWWQAPIAATVGERPVAFALARRQAASDAPTVTTVLHERLGVDTLDRVLLEHLDGGHDRAALHARVRAAQRSGRLVMSVEEEPVEDPEVISALIEHKLHGLWSHGLLVGG